MNLPTASCLAGLALALGCSRPAESRVPPAALPELSAAVQQAARERGRAIAAEAFSLLSSNLQSAIQSGGISNALPFCSLAASPLTAGLAEKHGVVLRRVTHKPRNPAASADATELNILNSFAAAVTAGSPTNLPPPLVTNLVAPTVSFFAPIVLSNDLCLKCHGEPGQDLARADLAIVQRLYPRDQATGFKRGDLRGAWRIDFPLAQFSSISTPPASP